MKIQHGKEVVIMQKQFSPPQLTAYPFFSFLQIEAVNGKKQLIKWIFPFIFSIRKYKDIIPDFSKDNFIGYVMDIIARKREKQILESVLQSKSSELVAVYGR